MDLTFRGCFGRAMCVLVRRFLFQFKTPWQLASRWDGT